MMKLSPYEIVAEIYTILRQHPYGEDRLVARQCALAIIRAELEKEEEA